VDNDAVHKRPEVGDQGTTVVLRAGVTRHRIGELVDGLDIAVLSRRMQCDGDGRLFKGSQFCASTSPELIAEKIKAKDALDSSEDGDLPFAPRIGDIGHRRGRAQPPQGDGVRTDFGDARDAGGRVALGKAPCLPPCEQRTKCGGVRVAGRNRIRRFMTPHARSTRTDLSA